MMHHVCGGIDWTRHCEAMALYQLELIDGAGTCAVIESAAVVKQPLLARMFGRMVEVEILNAKKLADYNVAQAKDRTMEFLNTYPDMYQSAGVYDEIVKQVERASTTREIVQAFTP